MTNSKKRSDAIRGVINEYINLEFNLMNTLAMDAFVENAFASSLHAPATSPFSLPHALPPSATQ